MGAVELGDLEVTQVRVSARRLRFVLEQLELTAPGAMARVEIRPGLVEVATEGRGWWEALVLAAAGAEGGYVACAVPVAALQTVADGDEASVDLLRVLDEAAERCDDDEQRSGAPPWRDRLPVRAVPRPARTADRREARLDLGDDGAMLFVEDETLRFTVPREAGLRLRLRGTRTHHVFARDDLWYVQAMGGLADPMHDPLVVAEVAPMTVGQE